MNNLDFQSVDWNIKEEPLEYEDSLGREVKLEDAEVKEEFPLEDEYFISPKVEAYEPVEEEEVEGTISSSSGPAVPVESDMPSEEILPSSSYRNRIPMWQPEKRKDHCAICLKYQSRSYMKYVKLRDEKIIIMTASLLKKGITLDMARWFIGGILAKSICRTHFSEIKNTIYSAMDIKSVDEIDSCKLETCQTVMSVVRSLSPGHEGHSFFRILKTFVLKNTEQFAVKQKQRNRFCSVCSLNQTYDKTISLAAKDMKTILMIGMYFHGVKTLRDGQNFVAVPHVNCCKIHFTEAINAIYRVLSIENFEDIIYCSKDLLQNFMLNVNAIYPNWYYSQFQKSLQQFVAKMNRFDENMELESPL